ncbi:MAG: metallophosphoesterase family protein [Bacteroidota bacterium]|nr:metallophosphoesterase family protein [Bacteroidota bacterium]
MAKFSTIIVFLTFSVFIQLGIASNPNPLKFNSAGTFKIVQFTDTHICYSRLDNSMKTIEAMRAVLDLEKPDFVIFTGDNITDLPLKEGLQLLVEPVVTRHIPYIMLFGNHDTEPNMKISREELGKMTRELPGYYNIKPAKHIKGVNNYLVEVKNANSQKTEALLYCMDSNDYDSIAGKKAYAGFSSDQVEWYRKNSKEQTNNNQQHPIPSLAFFHIPLLEYADLSDKSTSYIGMYKEKPCPPVVNTGMFAAMVKCGDVMGCFAGHDHDNDFVFNKFGIYLGYGRFTGSNNTYTHYENGARVIVLQQGQRKFKSWVRLKGGALLHEFTYPDAIPMLSAPTF